MSDLDLTSPTPRDAPDNRLQMARLNGMVHGLKSAECAAPTPRLLEILCSAAEGLTPNQKLTL